MAVGTPGGSGTAYFLYGTTPTTPTITSVSPLTGSLPAGTRSRSPVPASDKCRARQTTFNVGPCRRRLRDCGTLTCANDTTCTFAAPAAALVDWRTSRCSPPVIRAVHAPEREPREASPARRRARIPTRGSRSPRAAVPCSTPPKAGRRRGPALPFALSRRRTFTSR